MSTSTLIKDYMSYNVVASLASTVSVGSGVLSIQYATDTHVLRLWNGTSYDSYSLTGGGGGGSVTSVVAGSLLSGGTITSTGTIGLAAVAAGTFIANTGTSSAVPAAVTLSAYMDAVVSNVQGSLAFRNATGWVALAPAALGNYLKSGGSSADITWASLGNDVGAYINTRATPVITTSGTLALTLANHNNSIVGLNAGAAVTIDWNATGQGFSCMVMNNGTVDITPTLVNFTGSVMTNPGGYTKLKAGGLVALVAVTFDAGTTKVLKASGDLS